MKEHPDVGIRISSLNLRVSGVDPRDAHDLAMAAGEGALRRLQQDVSNGRARPGSLTEVTLPLVKVADLTRIGDMGEEVGARVARAVLAAMDRSMHI